MEFNVPPVGGVDRTGTPAAPPRASRAAQSKDFSKALSEASDVHVDAVPGTPPPEVLAETERASARYDELRQQKRELHFASDQTSGRVVIEVRDLDGNVLRTIPPTKALEVISGAPLEEKR